MEGSREPEVCLSLRLLAKSLSFFGTPRVKISLHLRFMVDGYSLYQPCLTTVSTFKA